MQEDRRKVVLERRKSLSVSAVESVRSFSEVKIVLSLSGGEKLTIIGTGLKITGFSKATGEFTAEGTFTSLSYGGKGLAARLFK